MSNKSQKYHYGRANELLGSSMKVLKDSAKLPKDQQPTTTVLLQIQANLIAQAQVHATLAGLTNLLEVQ